MSEPHSRPDLNEEPDPRATPRPSRWQKLVGVLGVVVVLWVGSEMYDVLYGDIDGSSGGHSSGGGEAPGEDQDHQTDPEGDGGHDPSRFDHG